jgi:hypothetical protein
MKLYSIAVYGELFRGLPVGRVVFTRKKDIEDSICESVRLNNWDIVSFNGSREDLYTTTLHGIDSLGLRRSILPEELNIVES